MANPTRRELWAAHKLYASGQEDADKLQRAVDELGLAPPRQQRATKPRREREAGIQDAILKALRLHPRIAAIWHAKVGAYEVGGRYISYGFKGCSDLLFITRPHGRIGAIEVKQHGQKPTEAQEAFLANVKDAGGIAGVCRSVDDAIELLTKEGIWAR